MFIETERFGFIKELEGKWKSIKQELAGLEREDFQAWVQKEMYDEGWTIYPLYLLGLVIPYVVFPQVVGSAIGVFILIATLLLLRFTDLSF